jgi:hypothetical protein
VASRAVDGNTNGDYYAKPYSVTHTQNESQPWWEVDLKGILNIEEIRIYNRRDCCSNRLRDFYVLVSDKPFPDSLEGSFQQSSWNTYVSGSAEFLTVLPVNASGRYVRVQLSGRNYLSLTEVEVIADLNS